MKKELQIGITFLIICFELSAQVTIEGRQFKDENGNDFYPVVCGYNVSPVSSDTSDFSTTHISPHSRMGSTSWWECECNTPLPCETQLVKDFKYLLSMGFNAIRVQGLDVSFYKQGTEFAWIDTSFSAPRYAWEDGFYIYTQFCDNYEGRKWTQLPSPYQIGSNPPVIDTLFSLIKQLLTVASETEYDGKKLKIIMLTGREISEYNSEFSSMYATYLGSLGRYIYSLPDSIKHALLAFELLNEPRDNTIGLTKQQVCENSKTWYDSLKYNDPDHLVTMGGYGLFNVFHNDPQVLTLDFYSLHSYPQLRKFEYDNQYYLIPQTTRIKGGFYWLQEESPMPWIIGETGLRTQVVKNIVPPPTPSADLDSIWGTLQELISFADTTITAAWQYSGSGYSWWDYQGDEFGLLYKNIEIPALPPGCDPPPDCCHDPNHVKEAHKVFESFHTPAIVTGIDPDFYKDPYRHYYYQDNPPQFFSVLFGDEFTGSVLEEDSVTPIRNAFVLANTNLGFGQGNPGGISDKYYTFSDSIGNFTLLPINFLNDDFPEVNDIEISASGAKYIYQNNYPDSGQVFYLKKVRFRYSDIYDFNNLVVQGINKTIKAWNDLIVKNIIFDSAATEQSEMKARQCVTVLDEFHAKKGSAVHIYNTPTFSDCMDYSDFQNETKPKRLSKTSTSIAKSLELSFLNKEDTPDFQIIPNPNSGVFTIAIDAPNEAMNSHPVLVYDNKGNQVFQITKPGNHIRLDMTGYSKGLYLIRIDFDHVPKIKKLVLN